MSETEKLTVGALVSALALIAPGFVFHVAPRFPGSLAGNLIGIAGAVLLVLLLVYSAVKRNAWMRQLATRHRSLPIALSFHVYAGVVGALLGIIHTGHKFYSPLGIGLVAAMLVVVFSGFGGHYSLLQSGAELREQQAALGLLRTRYDAVVGSPVAVAEVSLLSLLGAIADLEYAIEARETLKRAFSRWTVLHISAAIAMYSLLGLHIWNGIYYGLRWLD